MKIDNYVAARPQSGMDKADIVFEEPVEGGITRYAAVFQCQNAALVGPVRSARNIDIGILGQLGTPLLVHVGGINPVLANIDASPLVNIDLGDYGSLQTHPSGRVAPYDTYSSTAQLWGTQPTMTTPPQPLFSYSTQTPTGTPVSTVHIDFSSNSDVTWKYQPSIGAFTRFYNGTQPDVLADGVQNTAANVIVQYVQISYGPWAENSEGGLEVQADLYPNASGAAEVFRDGVEITGTWHRSTLGSPTQFVSTAGTPIPLQARPNLGGTGAQHHHGDDDALSGLRATRARSRQSSTAAKTPGWALASRSSKRPAATPSCMRLSPLASATSNPHDSTLRRSSSAPYSTL